MLNIGADVTECENVSVNVRIVVSCLPLGFG